MTLYWHVGKNMSSDNVINQAAILFMCGAPCRSPDPIAVRISCAAINGLLSEAQPQGGFHNCGCISRIFILGNLYFLFFKLNE